MKIFKISFLVCFLLGFIFAEEESYVFEAKGEFAKELKELVQKHSKDGNVSVNVYEKAPSANGAPVSGYRQVGAMSEAGRKVFMQKCASCHGEKGEKRSYGVSARLKDLTGEEIATNLHSYITDSEHGGKFKMIMRTEAMKVQDSELDLIIAYIKGEDDPYLNRSFIGGAYWENQNKPIQTTPTEQGSYLK